MITFDPDALRTRLGELETAMGEQGFWDDQRRAADISAEAHILAMQRTRPGMNEFQVESLIEAYMRENGTVVSIGAALVLAMGRRRQPRAHRDHQRVSYSRYERPKAREGTAGILLYSEEPDRRFRARSRFADTP